MKTKQTQIIADMLRHWGNEVVRFHEHGSNVLPCWNKRKRMSFYVVINPVMGDNDVFEEFSLWTQSPVFIVRRRGWYEQWVTPERVFTRSEIRQLLSC